MDHYAVLGNPIQHSLSPFIHSLFAKQLGHNLLYSPILVPLDGLQQTLTHFQSQGGKGVNITLPFKHQAYTLIKSYSQRAHLAEAINFIKFNPDGTLFGDNTDGAGLVRDLTINNHFSIKNKKILILGAGGAVRGILAPILHERPAELIIANRTVEKATQLARKFCTHGVVQACSLSDIKNKNFDLIINGTSASLKENALLLPQVVLNENSLCYDLVYSTTTPFLRWAKQQGATFLCNGIGMLIEQAAESFFLWRAVWPDIKLIQEVIWQQQGLQNLSAN